jgi:phosphonoacetaldehyde hydrolase
MRKIDGVMFDWAGTTIDYGCFAPLNVFIKIFEEKGIAVTVDEARKPMGLLKIDHIRALTEMPGIKEQWVNRYGSKPEQKDIEAMNDEFETKLFEILPSFTDPIPGVLEVVHELKTRGIKIGSSTGYTKEMMDIVVPHAKEKGYSPDFCATAEDVKAGRPYPWMSYYNAMNLGIYPMSRMVKVGDTVSDMEEGKNAGMVTVGVVRGSSMLGLSLEEVNGMDPEKLQLKIEAAREAFIQAGADYVIESIEELIPLIDTFENQQQVQLEL